MDLFVVDCAGESELLNKNQHYNAPATITSGSLLDDSEKTNKILEYINANLKKHTKTATVPPISTNAEVDDDDEDPINDEDYFGDIPLNSIDITQFIDVPPPKPKDPMLLRIEQFCQELKCPSSAEDDFERRILTDVEKEMKSSDTLTIERKSLENLSLKQKKKLGKV